MGAYCRHAHGTCIVVDTKQRLIKINYQDTHIRYEIQCQLEPKLRQIRSTSRFIRSRGASLLFASRVRGLEGRPALSSSASVS